MLEHISIENYKSLRKVSVDLNDFSVLVGSNAAGKSNFADALDFLSLVAKHGLPSAVNDKGGYENICFRRERLARSGIRFRIVARLEFDFEEPREYHYDYAFSFKSGSRKTGSTFTVTSEELHLSSREPGTSDEWEEALVYEFSAGEAPSIQVTSFLLSEELFSQLLTSQDEFAAKGALALTGVLGGLPPFSVLKDFLSGLRVFQILPSSTRHGASSSGMQEMGRNGENLPGALDALSPETLHSLIEHLQLAVPSIETIETESLITRELGLFVKEANTNRKMYSSELSDGTLRSIALFIPLVDPRYDFVLIEEPENCVHPWVIRYFVEACREKSGSKQIILTTHSPVLVEELSPSELFVVERRNGESRIIPATVIDKEVVEIVRTGIMKLGSYWDSGALGGVPVQLELFEGRR